MYAILTRSVRRNGEKFCNGGAGCAKVSSVMMQSNFTLEEANALLPWLEERFQQMSPVRNELEAKQEELLGLLRRRRSNGHSSSEEEINQSQQEVNRLTRQLQGLLEEVNQRGIIVRDVGRGLVDFPSMREGREIHLCWLRGELEIEWWHETNTGFAGRQRL